MDRLPPLPSPPSPPPRTPFPIIAVIAPAIGAVVIAAVSGSMFILLFAALSPIIAIATALDARRTARRHRRDEAARFDRDCTAWSARVPELHAIERARADAEHPPVRELVLSAAAPAPTSPVRVGTAQGPSRVAPDPPTAPVEAAVDARFAAMLADARHHPGLPVVLAPGAIRVIGHGRTADALARLLSLHPGCEVERGRPAATTSELLPPIEIELASPTRAVLRAPDGREQIIRPEGATRREHEMARARWSADDAALPSAASWRELANQTRDEGRPLPPGAVGAGIVGTVALDLLGDAPHALVGGTTGSGKSEFLRTLALSWAVGGPPRERSILLVDFKGGSAFAELDGLPHVVGVITDLDARGAERALRSLRAELRRRERVLADHGARDIGGAPPGSIARLLVLVDEYAALVETFPELQPMIADIASRGRSLGVHLVLCTQRPSGVVRDAIAANCGNRVAFRMTTAADAIGLLPGPPPAADAPAGRAVVAIGGRSIATQIATITTEDVAAVATRWSGADAPDRPWLPPLPSRLSLGDIDDLHDDSSPSRSVQENSHFAPRIEQPTPGGSFALAFGALDDPERQRRSRAVWRPLRDGALLVVGAAGSGAESTLAVLAAQARAHCAPVIVLPPDLPDALGVLAELRDARAQPRDLRRGDADVGSLGRGSLDRGAERLRPGADADADAGAVGTDPEAAAGALLVVPHIDELVAEAGDGALDLLDALDGAVRRLRGDGGAVVASCSSVLRARSGLAGRFDSVLLLRAASQDDHRAAGGSAAGFDPDAVPGRGFWQGRDVQVAEAIEPLPTPRRPVVVAWRPLEGELVAVVSSRPARLAATLRACGYSVSTDPTAAVGPGSSTTPTIADPAPRVVIADAETWQSSWSALARVRREGSVVIADATDVDARAVLGARAGLPMRGPGADEILVVLAGEPACRARWRDLATPGRATARRSG